MTTNQTIDGVPRELLERMYRLLAWGGNSKNAALELRALLDAPAKPEPIYPAVPFSSRATYPRQPQPKPAAQPQGEPVAWIVTDMNDDTYFAYDKQTPNDKPLYAEQPTLVAVVLPERMTLRSSDGSETYETKAWNACLDEVIRLNTK